MSTIKTYLAHESDNSRTLPYNHANSILSTSLFSYKLDDEFDFVEVFPTRGTGEPQTALDPMLIDSLFWAVARTKQIINRATRGAGTRPILVATTLLTGIPPVPAVAVGAPIPDELFANLGMAKPRLVALLERTNINPLRCFGTRAALKQIVSGLQQLGRETINWIVEAKWRSQLLGNRSLWDWEDPRMLTPMSWILGEYQPFHECTNSPASSNSEFSSPSSPANSVASIPPSSLPGSSLPCVLPFSEAKIIGEGKDKDVEVLLEVILHPTASRYAVRYPRANLFARTPLIENGYVNDDEDVAMDVEKD